MSVASNSSGAYERSTGIPSSSSFTACFWFRWTSASLSGNFFQSAFSIDNSAGSSYMQLGSNGGTSTALNLYCGAGAGSTAIVDPGTAWYFYCIKGTSSVASTVYHRSATASALTSVGAGGAATPNRVYILTDSNTPNQRADLGEIFAVKLWDAQLTDAEILAESYFVAPQRKANLNSFYPFYKAGTVDEGGNAYTLSALGTPIDSANAPPVRSRNARGMAFVPAGPGGVVGVASITLGDVSVSAAGTSGGVQLSGTQARALFDEHANAISWFMDDMPLTDGATGSAAVTLGAIASSAAGSVAIDGDASVSLGSLTPTAAGAVEVEGAAAVTLGGPAVSGAGVVGSTPIDGDAAITLGAVTVSAVGDVDVAGAAAVTLGAVTSSADGDVAVQGASAVTLGAVTASAAGDVDVAGQAAVTLGAPSVAAVGDVDVKGASAVTLGGPAAYGAGDVDVSGAAAVTLGAVTTSATGIVGDPPVIGTADIALGAVTSAAQGVVPVQGAAGIALGATTSSGAGAVEVQGDADIGLGAVTAAGAGAVPVVGAAATTLGGPTPSAAGVVPVVGSGAVELGALTLAASDGSPAAPSRSYSSSSADKRRRAAAAGARR